MKEELSEKRCGKCKETKPLEEFGNHKSTKTGKRSQCKECVTLYRKTNAERLRKYQKEWNEKNAEKVKAQGIIYREKNKEKIAARGKKHREENKERYREYNKQYQIENAESIRKQKKGYYEENKEEMCAKRREYRQKNLEKVREQERQGHQRHRTVRNEASSAAHHKRRALGTCGVYGIFFNGVLKYIGESIHLEQRYKAHLWQLTNPRRSHEVRTLQEEFTKHNLSQDEVTFKILVEFNKDEYDNEEILRKTLWNEEAAQIAAHKERGIVLHNTIEGTRRLS